MGRMQHFSRGVSTCLLLILALPLFCLSADSEGHVGAAAKGVSRLCCILRSCDLVSGCCSSARWPTGGAAVVKLLVPLAVRGKNG